MAAHAPEESLRVSAADRVLPSAPAALADMGPSFRRWRGCLGASGVPSTTLGLLTTGPQRGGVPPLEGAPCPGPPE